MGNLQAVKLDLRQPSLHFHYRRPRYKLSHQSGPTFRKLSLIAVLRHLCARKACPRPAVGDERCHTAGRWKIRPQQRRFHLIPLLTCISIYRAPFRVLDYEWLCFPIWNSTKFVVRSVCEGYFSFASSQHRKGCRQVNLLRKSPSRGTEIRSFHSAIRLRLGSKFQRPIIDSHCALAYITASN